MLRTVHAAFAPTAKLWLARTGCGWVFLVLIAASAVSAFSGSVHAQTANPQATTKTSTTSVAEPGPRWQDLTRRQRRSLEPLEGVWVSIPADRKAKWLEIAQRMPTMTDDERVRIQLRMTEWVRLGPTERGMARLNFQEAKQITPETRKAQWKAYQALSEDEKKQLAHSRKVQPPSGPPIASVTSGSRGAKTMTVNRQSKIVANPTFATPPTPIAPTLVHPSYGATTTLVTKKLSPPLHQQVGLPKIATSPEFVDPKTLLPRRGPQAAATYTATASTQALERP